MHITFDSSIKFVFHLSNVCRHYMRFLKKIFKIKSKSIVNFSSEVRGNTPKERFDSLPSNHRLGTIINLGDTGDLKYFEILKHSIESDPDIDVRLAALKRIHLFKNHPDLISFLQQIESLPEKRNLEPYLSMALHRVGLINLEEFNFRVNSN